MPIIRKKAPQSRLLTVFKRDNSYICGMCRRAYETQLDAKSCMHDDLEQLIASEPVKVLSKGDHQVFMCQICKRKHPTREKALNCVARCKKDVDDKLKAEQKILGYSIKKPEERSFKKQQPIPVIIQKVPRFKKFTLKREEEHIVGDSKDKAQNNPEINETSPSGPSPETTSQSQQKENDGNPHRGDLEEITGPEDMKKAS